MAQQPDLGKQQRWLERVWRWRRSGLSARAFCERHGLSEPSFYAWRRTLRERGVLVEADDATAGRQTGASGVPTPTRAPRFVAVKVDAEPDSTTSVSGVGLEIVVGDAIVRVPARFDEAALAKVLDVLRGARPC